MSSAWLSGFVSAEVQSDAPCGRVLRHCRIVLMRSSGMHFRNHMAGKFCKAQDACSSDEKPFVCDHTGCSFRAKAYCDLTSHKNAVHLNIRDKRCHVCEKRFHTNTDLWSYMATHEGDGHEMAKCEDCSASLKHKSSGKTKPAGGKFIHCDHPGGTFQSNIANHKRQVHRNERSFDCDHTGSECHTKTMGNLSRHKNTVLLNAHLKVRAKWSPVCDNRFFSQSVPHAHMLTQHPTTDYDLVLAAQSVPSDRQEDEASEENQITGHHYDEPRRYFSHRRQLHDQPAN